MVAIGCSPAILAEEEATAVLVVGQSNDFHNVIIRRTMCIKRSLSTLGCHLFVFMFQHSKAISK